MKKKLLALVLVVVMAATAVIGGTMAYLTDEDSASNVFTVGNISIDLTEEVDVVGAGSVTVNDNDTGATYTGVMPGDYLQKKVTVKNDGDNDAYVAVTVKLNNALEINNAIDEVYGDGVEGGQAMYDLIFDGWGINQDPRPGAYGVNDARGVIDGTYGLPEHVLHVDFAKTTNGSTIIGANNWFIAGKEKAGQYWVDGPAEYDGFYTTDMNDYEICYTYYMYLPVGESSTLFEGLNVPAEFDNDQIKMFKNLKIDVHAKAIQADNFDSAIEAFTVLNDAPALGLYKAVSTADELAAALADGKDVLLTKNITTKATTSNNLVYGNPYGVVVSGETLNGNGYTISAGEGVKYTVVTTGGTITNVTVNSGERGIVTYAPTEDVIIDSVVVNGPGYALNSSEHGAVKLNVMNTTLNGWTSFAGFESASFTSCMFGENTTKYWQNSGYAQDYDRLIRPYVSTTFTGCEFEEDFYIDLSALGNNGENPNSDEYEVIDADATVSLTNCTCNNEMITATNYSDYVTIEKGTTGHLVINGVKVF